MDKVIKTEKFDSFTLYHLGTFYVIEYFSTYKSACKQRVYKTYDAMDKVWQDIKDYKIDYTTF